MKYLLCISTVRKLPSFRMPFIDRQDLPMNVFTVPYDPNKSTMTIGEQILKQQQQQQAPVEYDMFGFPIDNTAGMWVHYIILHIVLN